MLAYHEPMVDMRSSSSSKTPMACSTVACIVGAQCRTALGPRAGGRNLCAGCQLFRVRVSEEDARLGRLDGVQRVAGDDALAEEVSLSEKKMRDMAGSLVRYTLLKVRHEARCPALVR